MIHDGFLWSDYNKERCQTMKDIMSKKCISENIIYDKEGVPRLSSAIVADGLHKKENKLTALIYTYREELEYLSPVETVVSEYCADMTAFEEQIQEKIFFTSKKQAAETAMLTESQINFIALHLTSTPLIRDFCLKLIFAFHDARQASKERK